MEGDISGSMLIFDDDPNFRLLISELLQCRGVEVIGAESALEASALIELSDPILALVDYNMPDWDGIAWVTKIREEGREFPVVLLSSSWIDKKTFTWLRNLLKVALVLHKPIEPELFVHQIEGLLPARVTQKSSVDGDNIDGATIAKDERESTSDCCPEWFERGAIVKNAKDGPGTSCVEVDRQAHRTSVKKVLLLGAKDEYESKIVHLAGLCPVDIQLAENPLQFRAEMMRSKYDAAILDAAVCDKGDLIDLAKAMRMLPDQMKLPLAVVCPEPKSINQVDIAYAGFSASIAGLSEKKDIEQLTDFLLSLRTRQLPRILTVDDDPVLTQFIDTILSEANMSVGQLNNPIDVMTTLEQFNPDLVVLDVIMPGLSGYDICRMLREDEQWCSVPVLFLTSKNDQEGRASAFRAGGNDFLSKPVISEELLARVRSQLSLARGSNSYLIDEISGVSKTKAFLESGSHLLEQAREKVLRLTVCALALDDSAKLNQLHGWASIERALSALGSLILSRFKCEDLRGRLGGDGFALAFLSESTDTIAQSLDRLLEEFSKIEFESDLRDTFKATFTAGFAEYSGDDRDFRTLVNVASREVFNRQFGNSLTEVSELVQ